MTQPCKPYRLLNQTELNEFRKRCSDSISDWNKELALYDLEFSVQKAIPASLENNQLIRNQSGDIIASISSEYSTFFQKAALNRACCCFTEFGEDLTLDLLARLTQQEQLTIESSRPVEQEFFYPGSTCLHVQLKSHHSVLQCYFHPQWVLSQLPQIHNQSSLGSFELAIAPESLSLEISLLPFHLKISELQNLVVGDVVQTNHRHHQEVLLSHQHHPLGRAYIGHIQQQKSIQITATAAST